jgi:P-type Ca2+ transporter type 2C
MTGFGSNEADNPFAFTPIQVGELLYDPKNLAALRAMGGLLGLTRGLRTDVNMGLSPDEDVLEGQVTLEGVWNELEDHQDSAFDGNPIVATHFNDDARESHAELTNNGSAIAADQRALLSANSKRHLKLFTDRRRVFGENVIPVRPQKSIFELMWIALHDKVLV